VALKKSNGTFWIGFDQVWTRGGDALSGSSPGGILIVSLRKSQQEREYTLRVSSRTPTNGSPMFTYTICDGKSTIAVARQVRVVRDCRGISQRNSRAEVYDQRTDGSGPQESNEY
jgi:hypothetical protein